MNLIVRDSEKWITLAEVARETGKHPETITRWCLRGILTRDGRRVQLEYVKLGRELRTSRQALARFIAAITPAAEQPNQPTPAERQKAAESAYARMEAAGA